MAIVRRLFNRVWQDANCISALVLQADGRRFFVVVPIVGRKRYAGHEENEDDEMPWGVECFNGLIISAY